ncbi:MAG: type VI secretion system baseplate subunit TssK [Bryobacteraceae bacterium]
MRLEPVVWTKGTFLNPQHLQSQDRFLEETLQFDLQALEFRPWGFRHLRIDHAALAAGNLVVAEAAGIFPDGLLFEVPGSDPAPPAKPLADHFHDDVNSVDLYFSVPSYRERGFNVASARRDAETRYRAEVEMIRDENTGQSEKPVMVARKNLRLAAEAENREGSSTLRVARVLKTAAGLFQLDPRFVPPLLDFAASDYLASIARRLVEILSAKSSELAATRRQKNQSLADFTSADIPRFWLLYTVNAALPVFRHFFETRKGHPEALYAAMLSLAGSLSTFSVKVHPRDLPPYDHDDLGACFTDLDEKLRLLLETVVPSNCVALPLKQVQPSIYATSIDNEKYFERTRMYLAISADMSQADLIGRAPQLIKICSADAVEHLVQRALPGVPLAHVLTPPSAIPIKMNYQYFGLSQSGGAWEAVLRARNLAAYVPGDFPNPQMELIVVLPQPV